MKFRTILEGTVATLLVSFVLYGQRSVRWNPGRQTKLMDQFGYRSADLNLVGGTGYPN